MLGLNEVDTSKIRYRSPENKPICENKPIFLGPILCFNCPVFLSQGISFVCSNG